MKKVLTIFGVGILALIIFCAVCFVTHSRLDASSKAYVDANIPLVVSPWSKTQLSQRVSSDYRQHVSDEQMSFDFDNFAKLGALKKYEGSEGTSFFLIGTKAGKVVTANYSANATFESGDAEIIVRLIKENGDWRISRFVVNAPMFKDQNTFKELSAQFPVHPICK